MHISVYSCTTYGIVTLEINSCNKELYLLNTVILYPSLFWLTPKERENLKMSIVYHGAPTHLHL